MTLILVDKNLICIDCQIKFIFTKGEQEFFLQKGFNPPSRCPKCRKTRKKDRRKRRRALIRTINAAESVHVEVAIGSSIADALSQESTSMGLVPAEEQKPLQKPKKEKAPKK